MKTRLKVLKIGLAIAAVVILFQLFLIQIIQHNTWVKRAEDEHIVQSTIKARRGEIYLMDGETPTVAVMNETVYSVIIDPMLADKTEVETALKPILGNNLTSSFDEAFSDKTRRYYVLARGVKREAAEKVRDAGVAAVYLKQENARVYPEGQMASSLLGFVNTEGKGQYGVEGALDKELSGEDGILKR